MLERWMDVVPLWSLGWTLLVMGGIYYIWTRPSYTALNLMIQR